MSKVCRPNRKVTDEDVIRLNSVGLSLATIGQLVDCNPATISLRLRSLGVAPADTRRSFMEDVFVGLNEEQREWLADQLGPHISIKDYVRNLIAEKFVATNKSKS